MAKIIPPFPLNASPGSALLSKWYEDLRNLLNTGTISQLWSSIDFSGSNITDIVSRSHNNLQSLQGGTAGEYYHITSAQATALVTALANYITNVTHTKAGIPGTGDIAAGTWAVYKDTSGGSVKLYCNDGGVIKSVALV